MTKKHKDGKCDCWQTEPKPESGWITVERLNKRIEELVAENQKYRLGMQENCQLRKRIEELEAQSQEGWAKYKELRKEVANNRYPELTAMVNAESVMESQSVLITKLQQDVAEADDAMCEAQWMFERAEATINKLREVAPKLVEVAEGGIRQ